MRTLALLIMVILTGCLPIYRQQMWETDPPIGTKPASFPGISSPSLTAIPPGVDPTTWGPNPVKILVIHGMGDQQPGYADATITMLRDKLHLEPDGVSEPDMQITHPDHVGVDYGSVHVERYKYGEQQVVFYVLLWAPLTRSLEYKYVKFDWHGPTHGRVWFDRKLKRELLDHRFTDAIAYAGEFQKPIQYATQQAICAAMTDAKGLNKLCNWKELARDSEIYVITHSLGSIILIESLEELVKQRGAAEAAAQEFIWRTRLVALLANQFPLFRLARTSKPEPMQSNQGRFRVVLSQLFSKRDAGDLPLLVFVAFSDPNDLLSFPVPDDWKLSLFPELANHARFVNVAVNNTWPFLGIVAEPNAAHNNYWTNGWVIDLIANGSHGVPRN